MKITFKMDGGFAYLPAFSKPFIIDTAQIDSQEANQLEQFVRESRFFEQPAQKGFVAKGAADYRKYTITIEDSPRVHSIQVTDPIADAHLQRFVSHLRTMAHPSK
jgi:hypothetical protein